MKLVLCHIVWVGMEKPFVVSEAIAERLSLSYS